MNTNITPDRLIELWKSASSWRMGLFYYCPEDPRVIVPKRQKWRGWTVNFARPSAIPVILSSIIFILIPLLYLVIEGLTLTWAWWTTIGVILFLVCAVCWYFSSPQRYK